MAKVGRRSVRVASSFISRTSSLESQGDNSDRSNHSLVQSQFQRQTLFENKRQLQGNSQSNTKSSNRKLQCLYQHTIDDLFKVTRTLSCIYLSVSIPLRFAFIPKFGIRIFDQSQKYQHHHVAFLVLDLLSSALFAVDAVQNYKLNRSYFLREVQVAPSNKEFMNSGVNVKARSFRRQSVEQSFPRLWFVISILALLPLEYITLMLDSGGGQGVGLANLFLLNRFFIICHLPRYIEDLADVFESRGVIKNTGIQRAWKLFFAMAIAGHWCCCGFFLVAKMEAISGTGGLTWPEDLALFALADDEISAGGGVEVGEESEVGVESIIMLTSIPTAYIQSLYWAYITMITTGFGDIVPLTLPETLWCIFSMCIGVIVTTCAIANLQLLVTNADAAFVEFQHKKETVGKYMRYRRLPIELQNRIMAFYQYSWDLLKGADEGKFLDELPSSLQQQVANFMCRDLIASLPFLRTANTSLLNALAECVEINIYSPKDEIVKKDELIRGTILISRGEVEVLKGQRVERKMRRLDNFSVESLFEKKKSEHTIRARTFCEVFLLPADEFQKCINSQCDKVHIQKMRETANMMSKTASKANKMFGSAEDAIPISGIKKYFHPSSRARYIWDFVILFGHLFYLFMAPLNIMRYFEEVPYRNFLISFIIGYFIDVFFLADLYLSFTSFMYHEEGLVVFDRERIREKWVQDHNPIREVIAALPIDFVAIAAPSRFSFLFRLSKLARLPDMMKSLSHLDTVMTDLNLDKGLALLNVAKLNLALLVTCHWVGCLWHSCADIGLNLGFLNTWRIADEQDPTLSIDHSGLSGFGSYLRAVYWAIVGMSTVGYGDIIPTNILETTYATVVILFGGLILPAIVGGLAAYLGNLNHAERAHRKKMFRVKQYMRHRSMKQDLIDKVMNYYDYLWSRQGAIDEVAVLNELPLPLRQEVQKHINKCHIESLPFLTEDDTALIELLASTMKPRVFMPNDTIVNSGEVGSSMYFIERGKAAIVKEGGMVSFVLEKGNYFGEGALLSAKLHTSTVMALAYCDVFELGKEDFHEVLDECVPASRKEAILHIIRASLLRYKQIHENIMQNIKIRPKCNQLVCLERMNQNKEKSRTSSHHYVFFNPDSVSFAVWNLLICIVILYNVWVLPYRVTFSSSPSLHRVDWIFDVILFSDMYLNYDQVAYIYEGEIIFDRIKVRQHYVKGRLALDLFATVPLDMIYSVIFQQNMNLLIIACLRTPRLLWLIRLPNIVNSMFRIMEDTDMNLAPFKLVEFLSGVILIAHWAGCGLYAFAKWSPSAKDCDLTVQSNEFISWATEITECKFENTWIKRQILNGKLPLDGGEPWQRYIRSFNWALPTLVVVVIGDVVPVTISETLYAFLWMVIGVTINGMIIGNVANIVTNVDTESSCFAKKADEMKKFVGGRVSLQLRSRVDMFISEFWDHREAFDGESFLVDLPATLQIEVTEKTRHWHISHCPFFDFCSVEIVKALSLRLQLALFSKGDAIINDGDLGLEMFFLEKGTVKVLDGSCKTVYATLTADDDHSERTSIFFGETGLFFKQRRKGTVQAASFCEVYRLRKSDLDEELKQRDFDLSLMVKRFTATAKSNEMRNKAVTANLLHARVKGSKLSKLIVNPDEKFRQKRKVKRVFMPNSYFRIIWDIICVISTMYFVLAIPFRAAFSYDQEVNILENWIVDFAIDLFFIADVYLQLFFLPMTKNGILITDSSRIRQEYMRNGMIVDILASVPIDFLAFKIGSDRLPQLRILHTARILRLPAYLSRIEGYLNFVNIRLSAATCLLLKVFSNYMIIIHWFGCIWFAIHRYWEADVKFTWATTDCPDGGEHASRGCLASWQDDKGAHDICHDDLIGRCYTRAIYFVLTTMSTVGYGDISPVTELETIYQNVVVLTGACFFAGIIGSFGEYLSQNDRSGSSAFKIRLQKLQEYMHYRGLPEELQREILFFHQTKWDRSHVLNEKVVTEMLPEPLRIEVSFEMLSGFIRKFPILNETSILLRKRICDALTLQMCPSSTTIYNAGDIGWDIYFIGAGLVQIELPKDLSILDEEGRANAEKMKEKAEALGLLYKPGNHFGESALGSLSGVRQESAIAKTIVELYLLSIERLDEIFQYTSVEERSSLRLNLQSRNGNTWHTFDMNESNMKKQANEMKNVISNWSKIPRLSHIQPRSSIVQFGKQNLKLDSFRRRDKSGRLRSFSAEAASQAIAIRTMLTGSMNPQKRFNGGLEGTDEDT